MLNYFLYPSVAETKGPKTNAWSIKEKSIPDWEKAEIEIEQQKEKA